MAELVLERNLGAPIERVFAFVTQPENLLKWWGPEGMTIPEGELDFTRLGPWDSVMMNADGVRYKVSGTVVEVSPPSRVAFTWAWHDESDQRGHESTVTLDLRANGDRTHFKLTHSGLADEDAAKNHNMGWTSSLRKLESMAP